MVRKEGGSRYLRNPDLVFYWDEGRVVICDLRRRRRRFASADVVTLLQAFGRPRTAAAVAREMGLQEPDVVRVGVRRLVRAGLLLSEGDARSPQASRLSVWRGNVASRLYHEACRDTPYLRRKGAADALLQKIVRSGRRPPPFSRRTGVPRALPAGGDPPRAPLLDVLRARRTHRRFSTRPIALEDLAAVVRGTWGRTGWIDGGPLGRLPAKTSPSGGALHPVECYVLAWNVSGLGAGLYHYDVRADELRRLRRGDLRREAVEAASGQSWVGRAAFLCILTVAFGRTLWKYRLENAYRVVWLDAGHLGQTFCLLATSRGLGPFTTAAIHDSAIEGLLGIDGVHEFPAYLCGAGSLP